MNAPSSLVEPVDSQPRAHLVLIGLRGSGKTSVGRCVAERERVRCIDTDDLVLERTGAGDIGAVFRDVGEPGFRALEAEVLEQALAEAACVLALGGGTPTAPGAVDMLRSAQSSGRAVVVYLHASVDTLAARLQRGGAGANRPALRGRDPIDEIATLYSERDQVYRSLADRVVDASPPIESVAASLLGWREWLGGDQAASA